MKRSPWSVDVFRWCWPLLLLAAAGARAGEWSGELATQLRYFPFEAAEERQFEGGQLSLAFQAEYYHDWDGGRQQFVLAPFFRFDQRDDSRSHFDLRELAWIKAAEDWELRLGVRKVFWGVTEFLHLVDIINQTDLVEDPDEEDKLGQPMVNFAVIRDWGTLDFFILTGFRERTFPGPRRPIAYPALRRHRPRRVRIRRRTVTHRLRRPLVAQHRRLGHRLGALLGHQPRAEAATAYRRTG